VAQNSSVSVVSGYRLDAWGLIARVSRGDSTNTETMDWAAGAQWQEVNQGRLATVVTGYRLCNCSVSTKVSASVIMKI